MLTLIDREEISRGLAESLQYKDIAIRIGRDASIVSREVARHGGRSDYRAAVASELAGRSRFRPKPSAVERAPRLRATVTRLLRIGRSPASIARWIARDTPPGDAVRVSHEAIYQSVATLRRELIALRTGRVARRGPRPTPAPRIQEPRYLDERPAARSLVTGRVIW